MAVQTLSALLAAIVTLAIGCSVVLRQQHRSVAGDRFALLCFVLGLWHATSFLYLTFDHEILNWLSALVAVAVPLTAVRFFRTFLGADPHVPTRLPRSLLLSAGVLWGALGVALFFRPPALLAAINPLVLFHVFGGLAYAVWLVHIRRQQVDSPLAKKRLLYLLVGAAVAVTVSLVNFVPALSSGTVLGNVFTVIYIYFLQQAIARYRLLDLYDVLGRITVVSLLVLLLAAIFVLLLLWVPATERGVFFFNALVASFVMLVLFDPLRHVVESIVNRWLFRERYELRRRLEVLRRELASTIDIGEAVQRVLEHLEETRRATHASIYLLDVDGSALDLAGCYGPRPVARLDAVLRRAFLDRLRRDGALTAEGVERELHALAGPGDEGEREVLEQAAATLEELRAGVCLPITYDETLVGLLCLRDERLREAYSSEEINLLRGVAAQSALTIQNSKVYERMKERERLAAIGEMAAGLAHEIRNPLGSIKGAAQFLQSAPPGGDAPSEPDLLRVIVEETNRLNNVVSQFLDYARPYRGDQRLLDLNAVVRRTVTLLEKEQGAAHVTFTLDLGGDLPAIRADAEQLRQVFLNLGLNAIQALSPAGGQLAIGTRVRAVAHRGVRSELVEISFRDTGPGIDSASLGRLFIPFYTTKEKGTGLGLPICARIIEHHGGTIEVRSQLGEGARFTVVLPVEADARPAPAPTHPA